MANIEDKTSFGEPEQEPTGPSFEDIMVERINNDYTNAKEYLKTYHEHCVQMYGLFHNSEKYDTLKSKHLFPVPFVHEIVEQFVADMMDKFYFKSQPVTLLGREETDKFDAQAKQQVMKYQDQVDRVRSKVRKFVRDAALYKICVAQVDYIEIYKEEMVEERIPLTLPGEMTAFTGEEEQQFDLDGEPITIPVMRKKRILKYKGNHVKRIDPTNLFFTKDKTSVNDGVPIMVQSFVNRSFFNTKDYFFNHEKLDEEKRVGDSAVDADSAITKKRSIIGMGSSTSVSATKNRQYVEWFGKVKRGDVEKFLNSESDLDPNEMIDIIAGLVDGTNLVRLDISPFPFMGPNIIVGTIEEEEDEFVGDSIANKAQASQRGQDMVAGQMFENLNMSVNQGHIINVGAIAGDVPDVNAPGWVLKTLDNVNVVHKLLEQPRIAPDAFAMLALLREWGKNSTGLNETSLGRGDPNAETLGEAQIVATQGALRSRNYMETLEDTFMCPLWEMRNEINMKFLDQEYVYRIIGEDAVEWRTMQPEQMRSAVDFVCEGSVRETNRAVITQQLIQAEQLAPLVSNAGLPIRVDKLTARLYEQGFGWSTEQVEDFLPALRMERLGELNIDEMLINRMLSQFQMEQLLNILQLSGEGTSKNGSSSNGSSSSGGQSPKPRSETEAASSAHQRNQTNAGR